MNSLLLDFVQFLLNSHYFILGEQSLSYYLVHCKWSFNYF